MSKKRTLIGCGVLVLVIILIGAIVGTCLGGGDSEELTLSARVSFDGEQLSRERARNIS